MRPHFFGEAQDAVRWPSMSSTISWASSPDTVEHSGAVLIVRLGSSFQNVRDVDVKVRGLGQIHFRNWRDCQSHFCIEFDQAVGFGFAVAVKLLHGVNFFAP